VFSRRGEGSKTDFPALEKKKINNGERQIVVKARVNRRALSPAYVKLHHQGQGEGEGGENHLNSLVEKNHCGQKEAFPFKT